MALSGLEFFIKRIIHAANLGLRDVLLDDPSVWDVNHVIAVWKFVLWI